MLDVAKSLRGARPRQAPDQVRAVRRQHAEPPQRTPDRRRRRGHADLCEVTVVIDGGLARFTLEKGTASCSTPASSEGMELPYACKGGVCSTCRAMLVEGEVDMDVNFALEDYEIARGFILTCQSYPVTDKILVDFDK